LETLSLTDLITACRAGDRKAQEQIFRSYYSDFLKICLRYAADTPAAEAALSDAFYNLYEDGYLYRHRIF
jgi:RNA polymerase sigma-70 factor (ECF subfamily)